MALGASVEVTGPNGSRNVSLDEFHVSPSTDVEKETVLRANEIVTSILIPPPQPGLRSSYRKVRSRGSWDFALAGVALALTFNGNQVAGGRVVLSGVAPVPWRSHEVEQVITGKQIDAATAREAAEAGMRNAVALKRNAYKIPLFKGVIEEELLALGNA
jgi:xanthine dehydrogenase YagS FAD-binding subunit